MGNSAQGTLKNRSSSSDNAPQKIVVKPRQIDPDGGQNGLSTAHAQQDKVAVEEVTVGLGAKVTEEEVRAAAALKDKNLSHSIHVNRDGLSTAYAQQDKVPTPNKSPVGLRAEVTVEEVRAAAAFKKDKHLSHRIHVNRDCGDEPIW